MKSRDLIKDGYMKSRDLIKGGYAKFKSLVKYGKIKWKVLVDENFYTYVKIETNKQKNSQITLTSPSGKTYKKGKTGCIKIVNGAKENAETGKYVGEIKNGKKVKRFDILLNGPLTKVEEMAPVWSRYDGISAFFILRGAEYTLINSGDLPVFFKSKNYKLPSGKLVIPEFFLLTREKKKLSCKSENCERTIMKDKHIYEKRLKEITEKIEEMGRARFGLAPSAL